MPDQDLANFNAYVDLEKKRRTGTSDAAETPAAAALRLRPSQARRPLRPQIERGADPMDLEPWNPEDDLVNNRSGKRLRPQGPMHDNINVSSIESIEEAFDDKIDGLARRLYVLKWLMKFCENPRELNNYQKLIDRALETRFSTLQYGAIFSEWCF